MSGALTFNEVDELLRYDPETGVLRWKKRTSNRVRVGDVAGSKHPEGYVSIKVNGIQYLAHRIVWLLKTKTWPTGQIDHIDHERSNNRFENLRDTNNRGNARNQKRSSRNTSGATGVSWNVRDRRWRADIYGENGRENLGDFVNKSDAIAARIARESAIGYHKNHGCTIGDHNE